MKMPSTFMLVPWWLQQAALFRHRYARPPLRQAAPELRRALVEVQCDLDDDADGAPDVRPAWATCSLTEEFPSNFARASSTSAAL